MITVERADELAWIAYESDSGVPQPLEALRMDAEEKEFYTSVTREIAEIRAKGGRIDLGVNEAPLLDATTTDLSVGK